MIATLGGGGGGGGDCDLELRRNHENVALVVTINLFLGLLMLCSFYACRNVLHGQSSHNNGALHAYWRQSH